MKFRYKLIILALMVLGLGGILYVGNKANREDENAGKVYDSTDTVYLWYSDDSLTDFFTNAAVAFHEKYKDVRVIPVLKDSSEYLENINAASVTGYNYPDIYVLSNESVEKAYLAGLASEVTDPGNALSDGRFPAAALSAATYHDKLVGYPLAFETSVLIYNKTYLENWAEKVNSGQKATGGEMLSADEMEGIELAEGEEETEETEPAEETEPVTYEDFIPETFDDLLAFADDYEAEENVSAVLKWDVSDIFYNYFFVGNYMIVGGDAGDDSSNINIYNDDTIKCLEVYQGLNQFFSIDAANSQADQVLKDFIDGKYVYTIATSNALAEVKDAYNKAYAEYRTKLSALEEAGEEGEENAEGEGGENAETDTTPEKPMEYGFALIPDLTAELQSRSLSVTELLVVNGYSEQKDNANRVAAFISDSYASHLYQRSGKLSASLDAGYTDPDFLVYQQEYATSIPLPKIVETSNLWVQLEVTFTKIWEGEDAGELFKQFSQAIRTQMGLPD